MKLIRDKYIDIIPNHMLDLTFTNSSILPFAKNKIDEELNELKDTSYSDLSEFADVIEALINIARLQGISEKDITLARKEKANQRGLFSRNIVLIEDKK